MGANTAETALPGTVQKLTDHLAASYADLFVRPTRSHSSPPGGDRRDRRPLGHHSSAKASHRPDPLGTLARDQHDSGARGNADHFPGGGSR